MYVRNTYDGVPGTRMEDWKAMPDSSTNMLVMRYTVSRRLYLNTAVTETHEHTNT
jgi:hypothetical protein